MRKGKMPYMAHILFLLDSTVLDSTGQGQKLGDTWEAMAVTQVRGDGS